MVDCEATDFIYPMKADIYYPIITQNNYGQANKEWVFDRTIICNATSLGGAGDVELKPDVFLQYDGKLVARSKSDIRVSSNMTDNAISNILVTNIRSASDITLYRETAGPRSGRGTIYEVGTIEPFIGPFGEIEYYKMLWRRTENQTVGD
ncbi:hypothetical protein UFOVP694_34 [uncultured Caudovirales phage]|uniref:Uncharacterized protein n=1 Tax=uncultured Caudovirales phage TaxID=2100421 RepID=A0A6J5NFX6_9CAUD|nr:hypothetical protein UFOVP694_34 [uncultured Caudovirales phage]